MLIMLIVHARAIEFYRLRIIKNALKNLRVDGSLQLRSSSPNGQSLRPLHMYLSGTQDPSTQVMKPNGQLSSDEESNILECTQSKRWHTTKNYMEIKMFLTEHTKLFVLSRTALRYAITHLINVDAIST